MEYGDIYFKINRKGEDILCTLEENDFEENSLQIQSSATNGSGFNVGATVMKTMSLTLTRDGLIKMRNTGALRRKSKMTMIEYTSNAAVEKVIGEFYITDFTVGDYEASVIAYDIIVAFDKKLSMGDLIELRETRKTLKSWFSWCCDKCRDEYYNIIANLSPSHWDVNSDVLFKISEDSNIDTYRNCLEFIAGLVCSFIEVRFDYSDYTDGYVTPVKFSETVRDDIVIEPDKVLDYKQDVFECIISDINTSIGGFSYALPKLIYLAGYDGITISVYENPFLRGFVTEDMESLPQEAKTAFSNSYGKLVGVKFFGGSVELPQRNDIHLGDRIKVKRKVIPEVSSYDTMSSKPGDIATEVIESSILVTDESWEYRNRSVIKCNASSQNRNPSSAGLNKGNGYSPTKKTSTGGGNDERLTKVAKNLAKDWGYRSLYFSENLFVDGTGKKEYKKSIELGEIELTDIDILLSDIEVNIKLDATGNGIYEDLVYQYDTHSQILGVIGGVFSASTSVNCVIWLSFGSPQDEPILGESVYLFVKSYAVGIDTPVKVGSGRFIRWIPGTDEQNVTDEKLENLNRFVYVDDTPDNVIANTGSNSGIAYLNMKVSYGSGVGGYNYSIAFKDDFDKIRHNLGSLGITESNTINKDVFLTCTLGAEIRMNNGGTTYESKLERTRSLLSMLSNARISDQEVVDIVTDGIKNDILRDTLNDKINVYFSSLNRSVEDLYALLQSQTGSGESGDFQSQIDALDVRVKSIESALPGINHDLENLTLLTGTNTSDIALLKQSVTNLDTRVKKLEDGGATTPSTGGAIEVASYVNDSVIQVLDSVEPNVLYEGEIIVKKDTTPVLSITSTVSMSGGVGTGSQEYLELKVDYDGKEIQSSIKVGIPSYYCNANATLDLPQFSEDKRHSLKVTCTTHSCYGFIDKNALRLTILNATLPKPNNEFEYTVERFIIEPTSISFNEPVDTIATQ